MLAIKTSKKGVGLVEIIICLMLISLIVIAVLPGLTYGLMRLHESGSQTEAVNTVQQNIENQLPTYPSSGSDSVAITFGSTTINIHGIIVEEQEPYGNTGESTSIKVFIPDK